MKKILVVVCSYFPIIGGAQTQAQLFAEAMSEKGYCVEVFTKLSKPDLPKKELINGVSINRYEDNLVSLCFLLFKKGVGFDVVFFLGFLRNSSRSSVVIQLLTSFILKVVFGKEIWLQLVNTVEKYRDNLFKSLLVKKLLTAVSLFLPISSEQMQYLKENLSIEEAKLMSPPFNFVDTEKFKMFSVLDRRVMRNTLGLPLDEKIVIFVGRVDPSKGILELLSGIEHNRNRFHLILLLAGWGSSPFMEQVHYGLDKLHKSKITVVWNCPDVANYIAVSDILIMPSLFEGKGTVQFEAMACGVPCLCSNLKSVTESLPKNLLQFTFNPRSKEDILNKLNKALNTKFTEEEKCNLRNYVSKNFSIDILVKKYERIFALSKKAKEL